MNGNNQPNDGAAPPWSTAMGNGNSNATINQRMERRGGLHGQRHGNGMAPWSAILRKNERKMHSFRCLKYLIL
jgi:hypothetical protein